MFLEEGNVSRYAASRYEAWEELPEVARWFTLTRGGEPHKMQMRLHQLMPGRLYVVPHPYRKDGVELREGEVLSRNRELGRRLGLAADRQGDEVFQIYRDLYDALRGIIQIPVRYAEMEAPRLGHWRATIGWLLELAWAMYDPANDQAQAYARGAADVLAKERFVRDAGKVHALEKTARAGSVHDARGRRNPGRLPFILWSADDLLRERQGVTRIISRKIDERAYVIAGLLDQIFSVVKQCDRMVGQMLQNRALLQDGLRILSVSAADRLEKTAKELGAIHARPFGPHAFRRTVRDLNSAAEALRKGNKAVARDFLQRCQRAMKILAAQRRLEEVLVTLSSFKTGRRTLPLSDAKRLGAILKTTSDDLSVSDAEKGFENPVLSHVLPHLDAAGACLAIEPVDVPSVYDALKRATDPF